jgi:hypothetical protein
MSIISSLIKNLRELIGQSNQEGSENNSDKDNRTQEVYVPVRYQPSRKDKTKSQEAR